MFAINVLYQEDYWNFSWKLYKVWSNLSALAVFKLPPEGAVLKNDFVRFEGFLPQVVMWLKN